jgi:hypothetical protein
MVLREIVDLLLDTFLVGPKSIAQLVFADILFLFKIIEITYTGVQ